MVENGNPNSVGLHRLTTTHKIYVRFHVSSSALLYFFLNVRSVGFGVAQDRKMIGRCEHDFALNAPFQTTRYRRDTDGGK